MTQRPLVVNLDANSEEDSGSPPVLLRPVVVVDTLPLTTNRLTRAMKDSRERPSQGKLPWRVLALWSPGFYVLALD
ncbi:hypothetical protein O3P69_020189 [Scylla paramamosain]|uniref:Uncharacterized protein n=1 Tax=Scylla paramamosain TaxID=85552 RepID=A0AAW0TP22_SCYPA